ncbi:unnamed protein product, partial [Prorocentrum cordatum]
LQRGRRWRGGPRGGDGRADARRAEDGGRRRRRGGPARVREAVAGGRRPRRGGDIFRPGGSAGAPGGPVQRGAAAPARRGVRRGPAEGRVLAGEGGGRIGVPQAL